MQWHFLCSRQLNLTDLPLKSKLPFYGVTLIPILLRPVSRYEVLRRAEQCVVAFSQCTLCVWGVVTYLWWLVTCSWMMTHSWVLMLPPVVNFIIAASGVVALSSSSPYELPTVDHHFLEHPRDVAVLVDAVKLSRRIAAYVPRCCAVTRLSVGDGPLQSKTMH